MKIGDLVHASHYPYWGVGMVLEVGTLTYKDDLLIHWFDNNEIIWIMIESLEKL